LQKVTNDAGEYGKEARWYMGLSYLKLANKEKADECFGLSRQGQMVSTGSGQKRSFAV